MQNPHFSQARASLLYMGKKTCIQTGDRTASILSRNPFRALSRPGAARDRWIWSCCVYAHGCWKTIRTISEEIGKATNNVAELEAILKVLYSEFWTT